MSCIATVLRHVYEYDQAQGVPSEGPRLAAEEEGLDQVGRSVPTRARLLRMLLDRPTIEEVLEGEGEVLEADM